MAFNRIIQQNISETTDPHEKQMWEWLHTKWSGSISNSDCNVIFGIARNKEINALRSLYDTNHPVRMDGPRINGPVRRNASQRYQCRPRCSHLCGMISIAVSILLWLLSFRWPSIPQTTEKEDSQACCDNIESTINGIVPQLIAGAISQALGTYITTAVFTSQMEMFSEQIQSSNESYRVLSNQVKGLAELRAQNRPKHGVLPTSEQQLVDIRTRIGVLSGQHNRFIPRMDDMEKSMETYKSLSIQMSSSISMMNEVNESYDTLSDSLGDVRALLISTNTSMCKYIRDLQVESGRLAAEVLYLSRSTLYLHKKIWVRDTIVVSIITGVLGYLSYKKPLDDDALYSGNNMGFNIGAVLFWGYWMSNTPYMEDVNTFYQYICESFNKVHDSFNRAYAQVRPVFTIGFWFP